MMKRTSWEHLSFAKIIARIMEFFGARMLVGLVLATGSLIFFGWLASEVLEGETKIFDDYIRATVMQIASPWLTRLMIVFSFIGSVIFLIPLGIITIIIFLRLKWKRAAVLFALTMAGEIVLDLTLKGFFRRPRPEALYGYALPLSFSFPSGHALGSFCFYGILAWLAAARLKSLAGKTIVWSIAAGLILLIGFSRIYLGVHYPSDVIGGYVAALFWTVTIALGDFFLSRRNHKNI